MSDIQPGDLVVCVDDGPSRNPYCVHGGASTILRKGRTHRVSDAFMSPNGKDPVVLLDGEPPHFIARPGSPNHGKPNGWRADRFRKLNDEPDNAEIIARIRKCQPIKTGAPSHAE